MENLLKVLKEVANSQTYLDSFRFDNKLEARLNMDNPNYLSSFNKENKDNKLIYLNDRKTKIESSKKYNKNISKEESYWIINTWGGIGSFKPNNLNDIKIEKFINKLSNPDKIKLTRNEFSTISSLSKVSFFYDINNYSIYDSRVIHSLNWIIFKSQSKDFKYFPMPNGRNKEIVEFPINAIIKFNSLSSGKEVEYYTQNEAYQVYNNLMKSLALRIFGEDSYPFYAEMLLFGIADNQVIKEMKSEIELKLKCWL